MSKNNTTTELNAASWSLHFKHPAAALYQIIEAQGEAAAYLPENSHLVREIAYYCPFGLEHETFAFLLALHVIEGNSLEEVAEEIGRIVSFRCCTNGPAAAELEKHGLDDWLTLEECVERLHGIPSLDPSERDSLISQAKEAERHRNYTKASYLMKFIAATRGKDVLALPEHTALVLKMVLNAPPAMAAEFDDILLPPVTHVDAQGQPVFGLEQVAKHLGTTVQELEEHLQERPELREHLHSGPAFPLH